ncbi:MAG: protein-L-isoaspartate(D-aspartate) O-methyltransferase [Planctomycetota bacterium]|jgi:protein-L-isoaspartate(D-aspartate) O-methyltransferase
MLREDSESLPRRLAMVRDQLRGRGIRDERVLNVFAEMPRELFIPPTHWHEAYEDRPVPIGAGQTISQPYIVALMTEQLDVQAHHRVLDVGAGSGYQTAILARLARDVFAIERIGMLAERAQAVFEKLGLDNIALTVADGTRGWAEHAPYDRIVCGAAGPDVPGCWIDQLADGGRIVMPVGSVDLQQLIAVDRRGDTLKRRYICGVRFVRLIGEDGWPEQQ